MLSIVPGLGHLALGRFAQGAALFTAFAASLNGVFIGAFWQGEEAAWWIRTVSAAAAIAVWAVGFASVLALTVFTDREALRERRDDALRRALVCYLRDELRDAQHELEEALRCDIDRCDADVVFHLGVIARRLGDERRARRFFQRCLACDPSGKWRYEVEKELSRVAPPPPSPGKAAVLGRQPRASGRLPSRAAEAATPPAPPASPAPPGAPVAEVRS